MENKIYKDRSSNFSREELQKLKDLIEKHPVILCKKTDHASSKQKDLAWSKLTDEFNSNNQIFRTKKHLIYKFNNLKKNARKELSHERSERRLTGGGPPPPKPSDTSEWLCSIMSESIVGLPSKFDSDCTQNFSGDDGNINSMPIEIETIDQDQFNGTFQECSFIGIQENQDAFDINTTTPPVPMPLGSPKPVSMPPGKQDADSFDTSTPKAMLKKPISSPLATSKKRKIIATPLETRRKIIAMAHEKQEFVKRKGTREDSLLEFAKEEHKMNMDHKEEAHQIEMEFKKKINELIIRKASLEVEIEEEKLLKLKHENENLLNGFEVSRL